MYWALSGHDLLYAGPIGWLHTYNISALCVAEVKFPVPRSLLKSPRPDLR